MSNRTRYPKYENYAKYKKKRKKPPLYTRLKEFGQNTKRIVKTAHKPNRKEYFLVFKICCIGIIILGVTSYVIQLIFSVLPFGKGG